MAGGSRARRRAAAVLAGALLRAAPAAAEFKWIPLKLTLHPATSKGRGISLLRVPDVRGAELGLWGARSRSLWGLQYALLVSMADDARGFQLAISNVGERVKGLQAGATNLATDKLLGIQFGALNVVLDVRPEPPGSESKVAQLGFINVSARCVGVQAGFVNVARDLRGVQIGALNVSRETLQGIQLGGINYAANSRLGTPVMIGVNVAF